MHELHEAFGCRQGPNEGLDTPGRHHAVRRACTKLGGRDGALWMEHRPCHGPLSMVPRGKSEDFRLLGGERRADPEAGQQHRRAHGPERDLAIQAIDRGWDRDFAVEHRQKIVGAEQDLIVVIPTPARERRVEADGPESVGHRVERPPCVLRHHLGHEAGLAVQAGEVALHVLGPDPLADPLPQQRNHGMQQDQIGRLGCDRGRGREILLLLRYRSAVDRGPGSADRGPRPAKHVVDPEARIVRAHEPTRHRPHALFVRDFVRARAGPDLALDQGGRATSQAGDCRRSGLDLLGGAVGFALERITLPTDRQHQVGRDFGRVGAGTWRCAGLLHDVRELVGEQATARLARQRWGVVGQHDVRAARMGQRVERSRGCVRVAVDSDVAEVATEASLEVIARRVIERSARA